MSGRLDGKTVFVTAAGQGIGRASAELFVAEGARVFATDIDPAKLDGLACETFALDVRDAAAVAALPLRTGPVDVLMNSAGVVHNGTILDCDEDSWAFANDLNVTAMYRTIRAYLPSMLERGGGQHRQRRVDREFDQGHPQPLRLRCDQGGGDRADQVGRGGFRRARGALQRDLPGYGRFALAPAAAARYRRL